MKVNASCSHEMWGPINSIQQGYLANQSNITLLIEHINLLVNIINDQVDINTDQIENCLE